MNILINLENLNLMVKVQSPNHGTKEFLDIKFYLINPIIFPKKILTLYSLNVPVNVVWECFESVRSVML